MRDFLTANWKELVMLNYEVDPAILLPYLPNGCELDLWQGKALVSLVGFLFQDTRLFGLPIPFHRHFVEVNLRFYVKKQDRRGVTFIKEIVPLPLVALVARALYNEQYVSLPMRHKIVEEPDLRSVEYEWCWKGQWNKIGLITTRAFSPDDAHVAFISEHYFGYVRDRQGRTVEYQVEHPKWRIAMATKSLCEVDIKTLYGEAFVPYLKGAPFSAFLAEGSAVSVSRGYYPAY